MTVAEYEKRQRKIRSAAEIRYTRMTVAAITESLAKVIAAIDSRNINGLENRVDVIIDEQPITDLITDIYAKFGAKIALDFVTIQPIPGHICNVDVLAHYVKQTGAHPLDHDWSIRLILASQFLRWCTLYTSLLSVFWLVLPLASS